MRQKLLKIQQLTQELLEDIEAKNALPPLRTMSRQEFKVFLVDKQTAAQLSQKCGISHTVFYDIVKGLKRPMRKSTKDRILSGLNIRIEDD